MHRTKYPEANRWVNRTARVSFFLKVEKNEYPYIVVSRKRHRQFNEDESVVMKQDKDCTVKAQKVIDSVYCHSTKREKKEQSINDRVTVRFEDALIRLDSGLNKKGCLKRYDKVLKKIDKY